MAFFRKYSTPAKKKSSHKRETAVCEGCCEEFKYVELNVVTKISHLNIPHNIYACSKCTKTEYAGMEFKPLKVAKVKVEKEKKPKKTKESPAKTTAKQKKVAKKKTTKKKTTKK